MFKKILLLLIVGVFIFGVSKASFAITPDSESTSSKAVNVGNKICPVTDEKIDENAKVTYEYQGKIYNFCCAACPEEFKKDPDKYIQKVNKELHP
jgi:YHS domain-containing protein